jgi:hypothetical protein
MDKASICVGFIFPGIIEDPGSFSGSWSSPNPDRGPDAKKRISLLIFNKDTDRENLMLQVNHPKNESYTMYMGTDMFDLLDAGWVMIAGAHRYSYVDGEDYEENENNGADMAREEHSIFQMFHKTISNHYSGDVYAVSIHGFGSGHHFHTDHSMLSAGAVLSNGKLTDCDSELIEASPIIRKVRGAIDFNLQSDEYYPGAEIVYDAWNNNFFNFDLYTCSEY